MSIFSGDKVPMIEVFEADARTKGGNDHDEQEMSRMGKKQELLRTFNFISIVGFAMILQSTWESVLLASSYGLFNGGTAGVIWLTVIVWLCMLALIASIAEMASMAPTAGGQYHWVSEFAPPSVQGILSYVVGWCTCLGWVAGIPACVLQMAGLLQQMVLLSFPDADVEQLWQVTLIAFLFLGLAFAFNIFLARHLALAESIILLVHILGFCIFMIVLWTTGPHADAYTVFTSFNNGGGWSTAGVSTLVGLTTPLWCFIGADAGAHMTEETRDAGLQVPRAMMYAIFGNGIFGISMLITFCFCIRDLGALLEDADTIPVVQILYGATNSKAGTIIMCCLLALLLLFSTITTIATTSRQIWAFSRDKGLPFSNWIQFVPPTWNIPLNALILCLSISAALLAINFGSDTALNAILSLSNAALIFSYIISVGCIRLKRLRGEPLLPRRWTLGEHGWVINDIALAFLVVSFVFSFFPEAPSVGDPYWAADFNWAIVIFTVTIVGASVLWLAGGNRKFVPPVVLVKPVALSN